MQRKRLVGLSLSLCIKDIIEGKVCDKDVVALIVGTKTTSAAEREAVVTRYRSIYWRADPDLAERLYYYFLNKGMIIQPRVTGHGWTYDDGWNISDGYWKEV